MSTNADLQTDSTPLSTKFSKFNKFVNDLEFDVFLTNPDSLLCKCNNFPFADRQQKHIVTGDLQIIKNNFLRKLISKDLNIKMLGLQIQKKVSIVFQKVLIITFQVGIVKMALIICFFWNRPIMLPIKLMKESIIWQIIGIHASIGCLSSPDVKKFIK